MDIMVDEITEGSSILEGTVSANSQAQASTYAGQLDGNSIGSYDIISSTYEVQYND